MVQTAGWRERVQLPKLSDRKIIAKLDTGAKSAALHAEEIELFTRNRKQYVRFKLYPNQKDKRNGKTVIAPVKVIKSIKSSLGRRTKRPVISTEIQLGSEKWLTDVSLIDRDPMTHRMLLGRTTLKDRFLVDPSHSFLQGKAKK